MLLYFCLYPSVSAMYTGLLAVLSNPPSLPACSRAHGLVYSIVLLLVMCTLVQKFKLAAAVLPRHVGGSINLL